MRTWILSLACVVVASLTSSPSAEAAPIFTLDGFSGYALTSDGTTATLSFFSGSTILHDSVPVGPLATTLPTLTFSTIGTIVNGFTEYQFTVNGFKTVSDLGGDIAQFTLANGILSVDNSNPQLASVSAMELLTFQSGAFDYDYSPFLNGGLFLATLQFLMGDFNALIQGGGQVIGTESFTQAAAPAQQEVPEPFSLAAWGIVSCLGAAFAYRCRGKANAAA